MNNSLLAFLLTTPLVAAVGGFFFSKAARWLAVGSSIVVAALALYLACSVHELMAISAPWLTLGSLSINMGILYAPLSAMMALVVGLIGLAVVVFSIRYMREDPAQPRYFAGLSLFTFSMLGVCLMDNLIAFFAFWEMVGFGSYLLIGHYGTVEAGKAANKAFLVNRLADMLVLSGIGLLIIHCGSLDIQSLSLRFAHLAHPMQLLIAALIFAGVIAKSAQLPGHLWLPDAMAGPTPVSAFIHAATMVAAGVYLLCRVSFIFAPIQDFIAILGAMTALVAALWAFGQNDIKRVLAYSTISQLGFMVTGFGLGSAPAAFFHLTTHAFFKALLFLSAGAIIDACHHEQDATRMGGLWKKLPFTFVAFVVGSLALAGFPYTAGFFSKDTILAQAHEHSMAIFVALMFTSLLTALYMGRLIGLVFFGKAKSAKAEAVREGNLLYHAPLALLALGALVGGALMIYPSFGLQFFYSLRDEHAGPIFIVWGIFVTVAAGLIALIYGHEREEPLKKLFLGIYGSLRSGFYLDRLWNAMGDALVGVIGRGFAFVDEVLIGGVLTKGIGASFSMAGFFAKISYRRLLTYTLYWILFGVALLVFLANR